MILDDHPLLYALSQQIAQGLIRQSANTCSKHAELYRIMGGDDPGPLTHRNHPWTKEMRDWRESWNSPKATQMGITEVGLDVALFNIDVLHRSVCYFLPKKNPDATDFSKDRFGTAIDLSPHFSTIFTDVNNIGHKKAGPASLYIRGTRSKSSTKSIPAPVVIMDEYDEMVQKNVRQAIERTSGHKIKQVIRYSTPTIPDFGIDLVHKTSTQDHFFFKCPACSRFVEFIFPDDLVVTADSVLSIAALRNSYYKCNTCGSKLAHEAKADFLSKGIWRSTVNKDSDERGFQINQFYSTKVTPYEMGKIFLESLDDPAKDQEWWNSKGGKAYAPKDSRISFEQIDSCISNHASTDKIPSPAMITMGVDQGKKIYYEICQWFLPKVLGPDLNANSFCKVLKAGYVTEFELLDRFMHDYQVNHCVADYQPERRKAEEFMNRFRGFIKLCYYTRGLHSKTFATNDREQSISVHRSSWLDASLGRFKSKKIALPKDISNEYRNHINALIRRYDSDEDGNPVSFYQNVGADHFGHARNYAEIALVLAVSQQTNSNIEVFL